MNANKQYKNVDRKIASSFNRSKTSFYIRSEVNECVLIINAKTSDKKSKIYCSQFIRTFIIPIDVHRSSCVISYFAAVMPRTFIATWSAQTFAFVKL